MIVQVMIKLTKIKILPLETRSNTGQL